ncbi:MAG: hypothetical protein H0Z40_10675 [Desulfotomaculum sp.]|nr:hypothetical protein [Desulfotomaculum sp.]
MGKYTVRGPGRNCSGIQADNLDQAVEQTRQKYPGKMVAADASEVIYVCQPNEEEISCQMKYR